VSAAIQLHERLKGATDVNKECADIDALAKEGRVAPLRELWDLVTSKAVEIPDWAARATLQRILESLSLTPGLAQARASIDLATQENGGRPREPRIIALCSRLAAAQPMAVIADLLSPNRLELSGCLIQESLFRRKLDEAIPAVCATHRALQDSRHDLGSLPITLMAAETNVALPSYGLGTTCVDMPFGPTEAAPEHRVTLDRIENQESQDCSTPDWLASVQAAFNDWMAHSNGRVDARRFAHRAPPPAPLDVFRAISVESLCVGDEIHIVSPALTMTVFSRLFSAAANGGAYTHGQGAAYGRFDAWRSMRALIGLSEDVPVETVEAVAASRRWIIFESPNGWFSQVAWDVGLICIDDKEGTVAYLAATDED
jgi:hypothetical protein